MCAGLDDVFQRIDALEVFRFLFQFVTRCFGLFIFFFEEGGGCVSKKDSLWSDDDDDSMMIP